MYVIGDININILDANSTALRYLELLSFHGLIPAYDTATWEKSCIDHVNTKSKLNSLTTILNAALTGYGVCGFIFFQYQN